MNNFEKFISLPWATQRRILRRARQLVTESMGKLDYFAIADGLTEGAHNRRMSNREQREHEARLRRGYEVGPSDFEAVRARR